ncbi:ribonuclease P protein component [Demequina sp.]|uniref:ribonuclease P protein component n=1 Tax=Demequina sp. TaxID=2050685 RepID=UPI003D122E31
MLPADSRLTSSTDFQKVMRHGARAGRNTVVVHVALTGDAKSMAGFAVSRAVGGAVVRNRVKRRLRAIMSEALPTLPAGTAVVVRALPPAAVASFGSLDADVRGAVGQALTKVSA